MTQLNCPECDGHVQLDIKEDVSLLKVGARCIECHKDFGVIEYVKVADIDDFDEAYERGEESFGRLYS